MKLLIIAILTGISCTAWAAVPPVQKASFSADQELKVTTTYEAPVVPGPAPAAKQRQIASESNPTIQWQKRQQELIGNEIQYWKYQNDQSNQAE
jgi:hypothetical protein